MVLTDVGAQCPSLVVRVGRQLVVDIRPVMGYSKRCENNVNPFSGGRFFVSLKVTSVTWPHGRHDFTELEDGISLCNHGRRTR